MVPIIVQKTVCSCRGNNRPDNVFSTFAHCLWETAMKKLGVQGRRNKRKMFTEQNKCKETHQT